MPVGDKKYDTNAFEFMMCCVVFFLSSKEQLSTKCLLSTYWVLHVTNCVQAITRLPLFNCLLHFDRCTWMTKLAPILTLVTIQKRLVLRFLSALWFSLQAWLLILVVRSLLKVRLRWYEDKDAMKRELLRETLEAPQLQLVPHVGYVSLFPFMMGAIPPVCSLHPSVCFSL